MLIEQVRVVALVLVSVGSLAALVSAWLGIGVGTRPFFEEYLIGILLLAGCCLLLLLLVQRHYLVVLVLERSCVGLRGLL